jgi:hypothetical protein
VEDGGGRHLEFCPARRPLLPLASSSSASSSLLPRVLPLLPLALLGGCCFLLLPPRRLLLPLASCCFLLLPPLAPPLLLLLPLPLPLLLHKQTDVLSQSVQLFVRMESEGGGWRVDLLSTPPRSWVGAAVCGGWRVEGGGGWRKAPGVLSSSAAAAAAARASSTDSWSARAAFAGSPTAAAAAAAAAQTDRRFLSQSVQLFVRMEGGGWRVEGGPLVHASKQLGGCCSLWRVEGGGWWRKAPGGVPALLLL